MNKCPFDPTVYKDQPIGMFHCPICGEMVIAGMEHPDYSDDLPDLVPPTNNDDLPHID